MARGDGAALVCLVLAVLATIGLMTVTVSCESSRPPPLVPLSSITPTTIGAPSSP